MAKRRAKAKYLNTEVDLPYFKQGDDFRNCLKEAGGVYSKAFRIHAQRMKDAAQQLEGIAEILEKAKRTDFFTINADTHMIQCYGNSHALEDMLAAGLVRKMEEFDDEDEEE